MAFVSFLDSIGAVDEVAKTYPALKTIPITMLAGQNVVIDGYISNGPGIMKIAVPYVGVPNSLTMLQKSKPKAYSF